MRETWARRFYAAAFAMILTAIGLAYMMVSDFAYYDNGKGSDQYVDNLYAVASQIQQRRD